MAAAKTGSESERKHEDSKAPYTVWSHDDENTRTWWGPYATLETAKESLALVIQHRATNHASDPHVRDCYRQRVKT